jgi:predicted enzyme related to lactoylglutathione lyase
MDGVVHFQMPYDNKDRIAKFYETVFGWHTQFLGPEMGEYVLATTTESEKDGRPKHPGAINGGFYQNPPERQHTSIVISVSDIAESMKKVNASGGRMLSEPMEIPGVGKFATFKDTEGNFVGLMQYAPHR